MEVGLEVGVVGIHRKERCLTFSRTERKTPVFIPSLQSNESSLCGHHRSRDQGGGGPNVQVVSIKRLADRRRQRSSKITVKRKSIGPRTNPC